MFENIVNFFKNLRKSEVKEEKINSKDKAKERLHLVLMQDRANVSADFLEMMKQEIIEVIKKYIEVDEKEIDVRLTNEMKEDGTTGAPSLYANIPIVNIKNEMKKEEIINIKNKNDDNTKNNETEKVEDENKEIETETENKTDSEDKIKEDKEESEEDNNIVVTEQIKEEMEEENIENNQEEAEKSNEKEKVTESKK